MPLQIWLLNPYEIRYPWDELRQNVKTLMEPVVAKRDEGKKVKYGHVHVHSRYIKPPIGPNDLAVYVVPTKEFGFVGVSFGNGMREHGDGLTTHKSGQACSEIYLGRQVVKTPTNGAVLIKADRLTNTRECGSTNGILPKPPQIWSFMNYCTTLPQAGMNTSSTAPPK